MITIHVEKKELKLKPCLNNPKTTISAFKFDLVIVAMLWKMLKPLNFVLNLQEFNFSAKWKIAAKNPLERKSSYNFQRLNYATKNNAAKSLYSFNVAKNPLQLRNSLCMFAWNLRVSEIC